MKIVGRVFILLAVCFTLCVTVTAGDVPKEKIWTFDNDKVNTHPEEWTFAVNIIPSTRPVSATREAIDTKASILPWKVIELPDAPSGKQAFALAVTDNPTRSFNLAINQSEKVKDLEIEVKLKALSGMIDQGGGPIWRVQDKNNYYITRWNPLETNLRLYYVKNGRRKQMQSVDITTDPNAWHTINVKAQEKKIVVSFDGKALIEAEDATFEKEGGIGLWTKADAATAFDDLKVIQLIK